jgi:hypothetical protein
MVPFLFKVTGKIEPASRLYPILSFCQVYKNGLQHDRDET